MIPHYLLWEPLISTLKDFQIIGGSQRLMLLVDFEFLSQNFRKVADTYKWYFIMLTATESLGHSDLNDNNQINLNLEAVGH